MKLSQAEYFLAVAKYLNFTTAAKSLYISQPALSKQIAQLEDEIGIKLLIRNSRKVALTAAGKQFEHDMNEIMLQIDRAKKNAAKIGAEDQPIFRVGCFDGIYTTDFLPVFYSHIQKVDPKMQIYLTRGTFAENKNALAQGAIDLLITLDMEWGEEEGYHTHVLQERDGVLVYSTNFPVAQIEHPKISDFDGKYMILMNRNGDSKMHDVTLGDVQKLGIQNIKELEVDNMATMSAYLEMGKGYALLASDVVKSNPILRKADFLVNKMNVLAVWKKENVVAEILMEGKK